MIKLFHVIVWNIEHILSQFSAHYASGNWIFDRVFNSVVREEDGKLLARELRGGIVESAKHLLEFALKIGNTLWGDSYTIYIRQEFVTDFGHLSKIMLLFRGDLCWFSFKLK